MEVTVKIAVSYEETQSNRVSNFCDFMYILFPKAILFYFYFPLLLEDRLQKGIGVLKSKQEVTKVVPLVQNGGKSTKSFKSS